MENPNNSLSNILTDEKLIFSAVSLSECEITNKKYSADIPEKSFAIMMVCAYPAKTDRKFAAFSLLRDYHLFFGKLGDRIGTYFNIKYAGRYVRVFSDVSPLNERKAACKAGLGIMGKNGLFISPQYGSFVFLGEIICSLTPDELEKEGVEVKNEKISFCPDCGKCTAACPSGAVSGDKSRCISSLTQKKGQLTNEEEELIIKSGYVWGCDICAAVCPLSRGKNPVYNPFFLQHERDFEKYGDIESMTEEEYALYPFSWRKKEIIKRNFMLFDR